MKDDNSCLFRSIGYVLNRDVERTRELREGKIYAVSAAWKPSVLKTNSAFPVVAASIQSDPINYSDAILGYVAWICLYR